LFILEYFSSQFLLPGELKRGAFMAKGRHSRGHRRRFGGQLPQTASPWMRHWNVRS